MMADQAGGGPLSSATPPAFESDTCEGHAGILQQWPSRWPWRGGGRYQWVPTCLLPCGRGHPSGPSNLVRELKCAWCWKTHATVKTEMLL